ncbi:MAG: hypothetical protein HQ546_07775, partial [Planctomycetes bacterium]|nr:hypothetical protein [Planctomycetota bacterium]
MPKKTEIKDANHVRIATVFMRPGQGTPQENLDLAIEHIDAAGRDHA